MESSIHDPLNPSSGRTGAASTAPPRTAKTRIILVTLVVCVATYFVARAYTGELAARALSIFVLGALFWATEVLPLFATAFVVIGIEILALASEGGLAEQLSAALEWFGAETGPMGTAEPVSAADFLRPFAQDVVILFMGGFLLSRAMTKHGIDRELARRLLRPFSRSPHGMMWALLAMSAFFSMWMSNTATAAMMISVSRPLVAGLPAGDRFRHALLLAVPFGANLGGIGTPIGTPPNAIAFGALNAAGYEVTFLQWMLVAVPLEILLLALIGGLLTVLYRSEGETAFAPIDSRRALSGGGRATLGVLAVTIVLWLTGGQHGLTPGVVALLSAGALSALGVLDRRDVDSIDWSVLILVWGGLSLGVAMNVSGLAASIRAIGDAGVPGGLWPAAIAITIIGVVVSTFMSNTATAALLVPAALALSVPGREQLAMLAAFSCSFAMAMPVSTPPNAIAYATGEIPLREMTRTGLRVSIVSAIVMLLGYRIVLPLVF